MSSREQFEKWHGTVYSPYGQYTSIRTLEWHDSIGYVNNIVRAQFVAFEASRRLALEEAAEEADSLAMQADEDMRLECDERFGVYAKKYRRAACAIRALKEKE